MFDWIRLALASEVLGIHWFVEGQHLDTHGYLSVIAPVPCFLALSGFMVLGSLEGSRSIGHFWWKRCCRILPVMLASLILICITDGPVAVRATLINYVTGGQRPGGNGPMWSLGWEEVAYVCLCLVWSLGAFKHRFLIWGALIPAFCIALAPPPHAINEQWAQISRLPLGFVLGNLAYIYRRELIKWNRAVPYCLLAAGIGIFAAGVSFLTMTAPLAVSCFGLACAGILLLGLSAQAPRIKADWSFGIYLYHWMLLAHGVLWLLPILCWASYKFIEKPALSLKNWKPKGRI
jgi:peptidoglycan/LPS O-acetylase OafA/YrhL